MSRSGGNGPGSGSIEAEDVDLKEDVPEEVHASLRDLMNPGEEIQLSVSSDITLDEVYGSAWLLATNRHLLTFSPNGTTGPTTLRVSLSEIAKVEITYEFGSGLLKVRTGQEGTTIARFSKTLLPKFLAVPREIETLVKQARPVEEGEELVKRNIDSKAFGRRRCKVCGGVIPFWMGVCPDCLDSGKMLGRLLRYSMKYWLLISFSLLLLMSATFIGLTPPLLMGKLIDDVLAPAAANRSGPVVPLPTHERPQGITDQRGMIPLSFGRGGSAKLAFLVGLLLLVNVSRNVLGAFRTYIMARLGQRITFDLRREVYQHLHRLSLSFYNERETGRIMASVTQDVARLQDFLSDGLQEVIRNILILLIICSILFYRNAGLAALVLLPTPLLIIATHYFGVVLHDVFHALWRKWAGVSALLADVIPGVRVVKAFAQEDREVSRFESTNWELLNGELKAARIRSVFSPIMTFLTSLGTLVIWWVGGHKVLGGSLTLGDFVVFTGYMWQFYGPVEQLCRMNHRFQRAATSAERVFEVLDTEPDVATKPSAISMPPIRGEVKFRDVTFGYEEGKHILKDLNFTVRPGEMIGLAGHSGAGKSTLINLICRFYDVQEGAIFIDGHDIRDVNIKSLRDQIGVVLQDPFLFNGTVAENIAYGKPEASMEEIVAAAKAANCHDFIMGFPEGYDTIAGERGARVSGGERQRISIARAILRNPRILILDEATASVDTQTESQIQEALGRLVKGRTTFAIAHRLSTLKNAHRLLILDKGKLAEIGTHHELIALDGIYANLCKMQMEMSKLRAW